MRTSVAVVLIAALAWTSVQAVASARPQEQAPGAGAPAQIGLLDAVQSALDRHPLLQIQQRQVEISRAQQQQRSGDFDTRWQWTTSDSRTTSPLTDVERSGAALAGATTDALTDHTFSVTAGVQRLLRSGVTVGPYLEMNRTTDNVQNPDGVSRSRVGLDVTMPLLRGRGREVVTAPETAARIVVDASLHDLTQESADLVLSTALSYWQYVVSLRQLEIITASETRARGFVGGVTTLAQADRLPRAEINQAQANLDSREAGRIAGEQQVLEARVGLALVMGLAPEQMPELPLPADQLPDGVGETPPSLASDRLRALIDQALARRADYLAAEKKKDAADLLRRAAGSGLRPQLDLTLSGGYTGLLQGRRPDQFLGSALTRPAGPDVLIGLRYSLSRANNLAIGQLEEATATYRQADLLGAERARVIAGDVVNAVTAVSNGLRRLNKARDAVAGYQAALDGESDKLRLGVGSITDILTVDGRLTEALLDLVRAQQAYAASVVQARWATGTLVSPDRVAQAPDRVVFYQPPRDIF